MEGLTSIRYDIVSLLVTGSEKALLRHHKNVLNDVRQALKRLPRAFGLGAGRVSALANLLHLLPFLLCSR